MNDYLKSAVALIPDYLLTLSRLIQSPQRFVAQALLFKQIKPQDVLTFLAISLLLGWLLELSFSTHRDVLDVASEVVFVFAHAAGTGVALFLAWRSVGGNADFQTTFSVHLYFFSVVKLMMALWFMTIMGTLQVFDRESFQLMVNAAQSGTIPQLINDFALLSDRWRQSSALIPIQLVVVVGLVAIFVWIVAGWGAYRELNQTSFGRSVAAFLLWMAFCIPVHCGLFLIATAAVSVVGQTTPS